MHYDDYLHSLSKFLYSQWRGTRLSSSVGSVRSGLVLEDLFDLFHNFVGELGENVESFDVLGELLRLGGSENDGSAQWMCSVKVV